MRAAIEVVELELENLVLFSHKESSKCFHNVKCRHRFIVLMMRYVTSPDLMAAKEINVIAHMHHTFEREQFILDFTVLSLIYLYKIVDHCNTFNIHIVLGKMFVLVHP